MNTYLLIPLGLFFLSTALVKSYSHESVANLPPAESQFGNRTSDQPIEIGTVKWTRDHDAALAKSKSTGKPIFALFQEVPGCAGCKDFGKLVLSQPLLVEAIESEFIPLVIYNNKGGKDAELLAKYKEPSWNYQVVRFLNGEGKDIISRKDRIWTLPGVAKRMQESLTKTGRTIPAYIDSMANSHIAPSVQEIAVSQHCFWTGEMKIGALDGVLNTEAGFYDGREVTRIWFDPNKISSETLIKKSKALGVADKVYIKTNKTFKLADYRKASASDQNRQLRGTKFQNAANKAGLNDYQLTKVNAFIRVDPNKALKFLSPAQRKAMS